MIQSFTELVYCLIRFVSSFFSCQHKSISFPIQGKYIYEDTIGEGAFSFVYKARKASSLDQYALKKVYIQQESFERSVRNEIDAFSKFHHSNIVELIEYVTVQENNRTCCYFLFPFAANGSLRTELDKILKKQKPGLPVKTALRHFLAICDALSVLHKFSPAYIHQDIKPDNILLTHNGTPLLTDFGSTRLALRPVNNRADSLAIADEASQFCTISYRSPELFDPARGAVLDTRTDVWALGCLLFAWKYGYSPFECEFTENDAIRLVESSYLRTLADIPILKKPNEDDKLINSFVAQILVKDHDRRPHISDVIDMIQQKLSTLPSLHAETP